jgi:REP element-mobilizing transposase RayT
MHMEYPEMAEMVPVLRFGEMVPVLRFGMQEFGNSAEGGTLKPCTVPHPRDTLSAGRQTLPSVPRQPRVHVPGGLYHAVLRGNHRQAIFQGNDDFLTFESIAADALERYGARLHAHCWMTNHVHLALQVDAAPLGNVMRLLACRYARFRQRMVPTTGHLFERRYRARLVATDRHLLALVRYIHQNPVRAGIVADAANYRWSSHRAYLGLDVKPWLTTKLTLGLLGSDPREALRRYRALIGREVDAEDVRAIRVVVPPGPKSRNSAAPATTARPPAENLEQIIADVAARRGLSPDSLAARERGTVLSQARAEIARRALRADVATLAEVAARLGRAPSTMSELMRSR